MKKLYPLLLLISINVYTSSLLSPTILSSDLYKQSILTGNYDNNIDNPGKF
jgi:hypothetical protein